MTTQRAPIPASETKSVTPSAQAAATTPRTTTTRTTRHSIRFDIEGMRAVAVGLVLLYHAGVPLVPGGFVGVDVFFVISGFLITGLLVREMTKTGRLSILGFYARRAKRLLPATAAVLIFVSITSALVISPLEQVNVGWDIVFAAAYVINWRLANQSVDYLAGDAAASPVQHFWSLAIEEQFYFVVPIVLLAITYWHRRAGRSLTKPLLIGLAMLAVPSLLWSMHLTTESGGQAYFSTTTRAWELALGGAVAVAAHRFARLDARAAATFAWLGLGAVIVAAATFTSQTPFPGYHALLPTLGTAAVLACGPAAGSAGPVRVLGTSAARWIGGLSYSLYLWHWPLLVLAAAAYGPLSIAQGVLVVAVSVVPAWLSLHLVEQPFRTAPSLTARPSRALWLGAVCTALGVVAGYALVVTSPQASVVTSDERAQAVGAAALPEQLDGVELVPEDESVTPLVPDPLAARKDWSHAKCLTSIRSTKVKVCELGETTAEFTVAVVGDSHAAQWLPGLIEVAEQRGWRLTTFMKSGCPYASGDFYLMLTQSPYPACTTWNTSVRKQLHGANRPDLVITAASLERQVMIDGEVLDFAASQGPFGAALASAWADLVEDDIPVVALQDTPRPRFDVPACVADHRSELGQCSFSREAAVRQNGAVTQAAKAVNSVALVDLTAAVCPGSRCPAVTGGVLIWRDDHHLTATYSTTLAPRLDEALGALATQ